MVASGGATIPALPKEPTFTSPAPVAPIEALQVSGDVTLRTAMVVGGVLPKHVPPIARSASSPALPNGRIEPLVWLHGYDDRYRHPFLFRTALSLPSGTVIRGVPGDAAVALLAISPALIL